MNFKRPLTDIWFKSVCKEFSDNHGREASPAEKSGLYNVYRQAHQALRRSDVSLHASEAMDVVKGAVQGQDCAAYVVDTYHDSLAQSAEGSFPAAKM